MCRCADRLETGRAIGGRRRVKHAHPELDPKYPADSIIQSAHRDLARGYLGHQIAVQRFPVLWLVENVQPLLAPVDEVQEEPEGN